MEQIREGVWSRVPNEEAEVVRDPDIFDGLIETLARIPDFQAQRWFNRPIRTYYVLMLLSCLSWNWRERSSVKITERTHAKRAEALHCGREGWHPKTAFAGYSAGFRSV